MTRNQQVVVNLVQVFFFLWNVIIVFSFLSFDHNCNSVTRAYTILYYTSVTFHKQLFKKLQFLLFGAKTKCKQSCFRESEKKGVKINCIFCLEKSMWHIQQFDERIKWNGCDNKCDTVRCPWDAYYILYQTESLSWA